MAVVAHEIHLRRRPQGLPLKNDFELAERSLEDPKMGQLLVKNLWMSVDPYMRGRMSDRKSYIAPFQIGEPLEGDAIGVVEQSASPDFRVGDVVSHFSGWRDYALVKAADASKIESGSVPIQAYLGPLGSTGFTAYLGVTKIGHVQPGETVFVSGAAGAVGSIACQIAKIKGCRVVASAGSPEKIAWLQDEAGVDVAINYKAVENFAEALSAACPEGLDVCFDNVGREQLDAAITVANNFARFALCGMIAQYNSENLPPGPPHILQAVGKRLTLQGFLVIDHWDLLPEFSTQMSTWIADKRVKWRETVIKGLDRAPQAFLGLFRGDNVGKMLVDLI
jgi:NADPH-dependent curcumin reductase CurA